MTRKTFKTKEPVILEGYQAVLKPSKFGYSLSTVIDQELVDQLEDDRIESLKWCESKLKNPKRSVLKPEPWEEVSEGQYKVKYSWNEENRPPIMDTKGVPITDENTPLYSGSKVKVAFYQKPYILKDNITYGTTLKCIGVQIVAVNGQAGVDTGDMNVEDVAALFGTMKGFEVSEPNITPTAPSSVNEDDDF